MPTVPSRQAARIRADGDPSGRPLPAARIIRECLAGWRPRQYCVPTVSEPGETMVDLVHAPAPTAVRGWTLHARRLAAVGWAALLAGLLVGGPLGRIAMRVLAVHNPEDTGTLTDDGFPIGEVTLLGTVQVLAAATQICMLGAVVYLFIRPLLLGPTWARVATAALGTGSAVAALIIAPEHFDFRDLQSQWLAALMFLAIPVVTVVVFGALAERFLRPGSWFMTASMSVVGASLAVWLLAGVSLVLVVPLLLLAGAVLWAARSLRLTHPVRERFRWTGRVGLVAIFALAVTDLTGDLSAIW
jgi:hypothetical protein